MFLRGQCTDSKIGSPLIHETEEEFGDVGRDGGIRMCEGGTSE